MKLNDDYLIDLPTGYRQTSDLWEMGERAMDLANEEFILSELRALAPEVKEGKVAHEYSYSFEVVEEGDWYFACQRIVYRCPLSDERFKKALRQGYVQREWFIADADGHEAEDGPYALIDCLLSIKKQLANYPVLDDERYDELCLAARVEMVQGALPAGCPPLTTAQAERVVYALEQNSWPPDDPNEHGIPGKYQVEWVGDGDHHIYGIPGENGPYEPNKKYIDLDECVKFALRKLSIYPHWGRRRKG